MQTDPSRRAANRVTKKIAAALAGKRFNGESRKGTSRARRPEADGDLLRLIAQRLAENGPEAARLRAGLSGTVEQDRSDEEPLRADS